ncbi:unnamed protein product [Lampetra fluviatilis]
MVYSGGNETAPLGWWKKVPISGERLLLFLSRSRETSPDPAGPSRGSAHPGRLEGPRLESPPVGVCVD